MTLHLQIGEVEKATDRNLNIIYHIHWTACGIKMYSQSSITDDLLEPKLCGTCKRSNLYKKLYKEMFHPPHKER